MALRRFKYRMHHTWVTDSDVGDLVPMFCQEVTPGDTWQGVQNGIVRMTQLNHPAYVSMKVDTFFFFVPHRLVWNNWEDFITNKVSGTIPNGTQASLTGTGTVATYLGIQPNDTADGAGVINKMAITAYNLVYNEFFLDQSQTPIDINTNTSIRQSQFSPNDYYSSMRDELQQGSTETVDSSGATIDITDIRDAFHRQKFRERRSQYGERYHDYLRAMGLRVPDSRLDRPEFVARGGGRVGISEVVSTNQSANVDLGEYKGHGIATTVTRFKKRVFLEHGTLLGLVTIRPRQQLRQKVERKYLITENDDFYQPEQRLDTQDVYYYAEFNSELDGAGWKTANGYQPKYEWLRKPVDVIAGNMGNSSYAAWTASRNWAYSVVPDGDSIRAVPQYTELWQDNTIPDFKMYFDNRISKRSIIGRRPR